MAKKIDDVELINRIMDTMIYHQSVEDGLKRLERCYRGAKTGSDRRGLAIIGETGSGKSRLLRRFANQYPEYRVPEGKKVPILKVLTPSKPTQNSLVEHLLFRIGDPKYDKGTENQKTIRLIEFLEKAETHLIILDEFQHFVDQGTSKIQHHVADGLKNIVTDANVNLVVSGLPKCSQVIQTNKQLRRRIQKPVILPRFNWLDEEHRVQFCSVLVEMQELIPELEFPDLTNVNMAFRFYCASGGLIGYMANLFVEIIQNVYEKNTLKVTLPVLSEAANDASYDSPNEIKNPFHSSSQPAMTHEAIDLAKSIGTQADEEPATMTRKSNKMKVSTILSK